MRNRPDWLSTLHHDGSAKYVSSPSPRVGETVRLRVRVGTGAPVRRIFVRTSVDGYQVFTPMAPNPVTAPAQWYAAELPIHRALTAYRFVVESDDGVWSYTAAGATPYSPPDHTDFRLVAGDPPPAWMRGAVFYQLVVDRFANGDPSRDPGPDEPGAYREYEYAPGPRTFPWGEPPPPEQPFSLVFYGGDLDGLVQRLDHLAELGVDVLALTPVFTSPSSHRYDTADHHHVDPRLGGDAALARLREALSARGMRYLLELDLQAVSSAHPWFRAALKDGEAPEAEMFHRTHTGGFERWLGTGTQRRLDQGSAVLVRSLFTGRDAVVRRWLAPPFSADGWTLHFSLPYPHQALARAAVRETRPEACLVTRSHVDASAALQGDGIDGAAEHNAFALPLWHWLASVEEQQRDGTRRVSGGPLSTEALDDAWQAGRAVVPWRSVLHRLLMIDGNDFQRIRTRLGGSAALHQLAAVIQFTAPGIPVVYYGDEVGLEDVPVLEQRGCMVWDRTRWDGALFALYRSLIALRKSCEPLRDGGFQTLAVEPDTLVYQREGLSGRVLVVAHRAERPRAARPVPVEAGGIANGTRFVEHFSGRTAVVRGGMLGLPELGQGGTIWIAKDPPRRGRPPRVPDAGLAGDQRCPRCERADGSRLDSDITASGATAERRWVCLFCGAVWKRTLPPRGW